jgi:glycosyltransferase involved in cell wall biosynthesis
MDSLLNPTKPWHVSAVIPARNEELLLSRCLQSLLTAAAEVSAPDTADIILVSDSSTDRTTAVAKRCLKERGLVVVCDEGAVGPARRLGVKNALRRRRAPISHCWIANTDADCIVSNTWLTDQLTLAKRGVEAVAGTIAIDNFDDFEAEVPARFRESYLIHPDGSHPHVHACNIGLRADVYLHAGEWPSVITGEDHALWQKLLQDGVKPLSTCDLNVVTSGRRVGRAPNGFAAALAAHSKDAA